MFDVFTAREFLTRMRKGKFDTVASSLVKSYEVCQAITDDLLCSVYSYIFLVSSLKSHFVLGNKDRAQGKPTKKKEKKVQRVTAAPQAPRSCCPVCCFCIQFAYA